MRRTNKAQTKLKLERKTVRVLNPRALSPAELDRAVGGSDADEEARCYTIYWTCSSF